MTHCTQHRKTAGAVRSAIPRRGNERIGYQRTYMRMCTLEMERARLEKIKHEALHRIEDSDARLSIIAAEMEELKASTQTLTLHPESGDPSAEPSNDDPLFRHRY